MMQMLMNRCTELTFGGRPDRQTWATEHKALWQRRNGWLSLQRDSPDCTYGHKGVMEATGSMEGSEMASKKCCLEYTSTPVWKRKGYKHTGDKEAPSSSRRRKVWTIQDTEENVSKQEMAWSYAPAAFQGDWGRGMHWIPALSPLRRMRWRQSHGLSSSTPVGCLYRTTLGDELLLAENQHPGITSHHSLISTVY